jgi:hypothetical protein
MWARDAVLAALTIAYRIEEPVSDQPSARGAKQDSRADGTESLISKRRQPVDAHTTAFNIEGLQSRPHPGTHDPALPP